MDLITNFLNLIFTVGISLPIGKQQMRLSCQKDPIGVEVVKYSFKKPFYFRTRILEKKSKKKKTYF